MLEAGDQLPVPTPMACNGRITSIAVKVHIHWTQAMRQGISRTGENPANLPRLNRPWAVVAGISLTASSADESVQTYPLRHSGAM